MPNSEYHTLGRNLGKPDAIGSGEESGGLLGARLCAVVLRAARRPGERAAWLS